MKAPAEGAAPEREAGRRASGTRPARGESSVEPAAAGADHAHGVPARPISPAVARRLQGTAGNRAVSRLVAQRRTAQAPRPGGPAARPSPTQTAATPAGGQLRAPESGTTASGIAATATAGTETAVVSPQIQRLVEPPAATGARAGPEADPKFAALKADLRGKQHRLVAHPPPKAEADAAQHAALPPQDDKEAQGKAANAEKMNAAKPGEFDKAGFIKAVNDAIAAQAPKNLDEADKFGGSGKADAVKGQVAGQVSAGKEKSAGPIESTTNAPPDTSRAKEKPVTPLRPDQPPAAPAGPDPAQAVPDRAPPSATDFSAGPAQVNDQMATAQVTEEQLARANEPEFGDALAAKKEGEAHAATAPGQVRGAEAQTLAGAKAQAAQAGAAALTAMTGDRRTAGAAVTAGKTDAKGSDEAKRAQVTATLQKVFDATKKDVEDILSGLDKKVDDKFNTDEKSARNAFTAEHKRRMDAYKEERYSGLIGKGRWLKDKFAGLPAEANQIFVQARAGYVAKMQQVISSVADLIGTELGRAKQRIATGRAQLQAEVAKLPKDLQAIGKEAAGEFAGKFDELTESVNSKGSELVQTLASKYNEALGKVDEEIAAEKEKNKGLVAKAADAIGGVIKTILELKDLLLGVLAKAASAVMAIIKDPIGFLGHLVSAVGAGLSMFMSKIGEHLKKGLIGWLVGAMSGAGLQLPEKFDLRGIIMMIGSLLNLTWSSLRSRIVSRGVPEQAMGAVEQSVPIAQKLQSEGVGGIWQDIVEKVGDLKTKLFSKISEYLIPTVLIAGITWIISLLNPASAFIKACKMIVDIVTFIVQRGAQIVQFVNAVLDAIIAIAGGGAGGVPALIEKALVLSIPVLIGALAAILGIGGIAEKVKKFFQALSKPVMKAVDFVVDKIVKLGKGIWAKLKAGIGKAKDKFGRGGKDQPDGAAPARGAERLAIAAAERLLSTKPDEEQVRHQLPGISRRHGTPLRLVVDSRQPATSRVHVQTMSTDQHDIPPARPGELEQLDAVLGRPRVDALCESLGEAKVINLVKDLGPYGVQKLADGLSDSDVGALLGTLDPSLPAKIFKGRQPATGVEFKKLFDRFGATDVNLLAAALGGKLALIVKWDMFQFHATQQQRLDANQGHTARSMPPLFGRTVSDVRAILTARGMTLAHAEPDHEMWTHPDHSVVRLKTGPAAHGPHTPFNHVVLEVTKTAGDVDIDEVYAKVTESGQPAPQGTKQAEDQLAAWFKARVGRLPRPNELDAMMSMWGKVTHIKLQ